MVKIFAAWQPSFLEAVEEVQRQFDAWAEEHDPIVYPIVSITTTHQVVILQDNPRHYYTLTVLCTVA